MHIPYKRVSIVIALVAISMWIIGAQAWAAEAPRAKVSFIDEQDHFTVVIKSQSVLTHRLTTVGKMNSPVLDVDAVMDGTARFATPKLPGAARVAVEWYRAKPPVIRIRVRLSRNIKYDLKENSGGRELILSVYGENYEPPLVEPTAELMDTPAANDTSDQIPEGASAAKNVIAKPIAKDSHDAVVAPTTQETSPDAVLKLDTTIPTKVEAETPKSRAEANLNPNPEPASKQTVVPSKPVIKQTPVGTSVPSDGQAQSIQRSTLPAQPGSAQRLSLNFAKADLPTVLRSLALQSGANIVVGPNVKGDVSLNLQNVTLAEALEYISTVYGIKVQFDGKTYLIHTAEQVREGGTGPASIDMVPFSSTGAKLMQDVLTATFPALRIKVSMLNDTTSKMRGISTQFVTLIGPKEDVDNAKKLVEQLESLHKKEQEDVYTKIYRVRHSRIQDLFSTIGWMLPTVKVYLGPRNSQSTLSSKEMEGGLKFSDIDLEATASAVGGKTESGTAPAGPPTTDSGGSNGSSQAAAGGEKTQVMDDTSNTIILLGPRVDVDKAMEMLAQLDVSKPQIMIEAKIVDLTDGLDNTFGFAPDYSGSTAHMEVDDRGRLNILRTLDPTTSINDVFSTIATPLSLDMHLKALIDKNKAKLLASPKSLTMEGIPSTLFIGDTLRYISSIMQTNNGVTITTEQVEVGVKLTCNAKLAGNDEVVLMVEPEISSITDITLNAQGVALPRISKRNTTNTVRVKSGETIVLSGLIKETDIKKSSKIPLLGDLPIFGYLFRQDSSSKSKSEVVVFVTATIVDDGGKMSTDQLPTTAAPVEEPLK
ncbi:MAG: hypothetical protein ACYC1M_04310 [Armatimonadota bacterium]